MGAPQSGGSSELVHSHRPGAVGLVLRAVEIQAAAVPQVDAVEPLQESQETRLRGRGEGGRPVRLWEVAEVDGARQGPGEL